MGFKQVHVVAVSPVELPVIKHAKMCFKYLQVLKLVVGLEHFFFSHI